MIDRDIPCVGIIGTSLLNEPLSDHTEHDELNVVLSKVMVDDGISGTEQLRVDASPIRKLEGNGSVKKRLSTEK